MPQVIRGSHTVDADAHAAVQAVSRPSFGIDQHPSIRSANSATSPLGSPAEEHVPRSFPLSPSHPHEQAVTSTSPPPERRVAFRADSNEPITSPISLDQDRRRSSFFTRRSSEIRPEADAYYDSRAATKREWRRRATTLEAYYQHNPALLPQLPFTWHRGKKRWRLIILIVLMWLDACAVPIALYYGLAYGADVEGWIIFAVVTTIWGGPTYLEYGVRTLKLMRKERFYRPLGTEYRWCFDYLTWVGAITIFVVTALFIVGGAPHEVFLRVLCMPMPALLYCLGLLAGFPTFYHYMKWPAPFRISSTAKGNIVKPGVYYFVEDTVALNANAGRPYREALAARYEASPRFRQMMYHQSVFWTIPPLLLAVPLTAIACHRSVSPHVAYAFCWAIPFIWATIWGFISMYWGKRDMVRERKEWEANQGPVKIQDIEANTDTSSNQPLPEDGKDPRPNQAV